MQTYKEPSFQDRMAVAQNAKNKALKQLNSRVAVDPVERDRRIAERAAKDEAQQIKRGAVREAKKAAQASKELAKREEARLAAETAPAEPPRVLDEAELKSARDARYAARKARKTRRS